MLSAMQQHLLEMKIYPWAAVNLDTYKRMETVPMAEIIFISMNILCLFHARSHHSKQQRQKHQLLWICSLVGAAPYHFYFSTIPSVNNFWHCQATLMLAPRIPVYYLCYLSVRLYLPTAIAWLGGFSNPAQPPMTGLVAVLISSGFDMVGLKMLWFTFHDSDNMTNPRIVGVPYSLIMFVCVSSCTFVYIFNKTPVVLEHVAGSGYRYGYCESICTVGAVVLLSLPLTIIQMAIMQCILGSTFPPKIAPPNMMMLLFMVAMYIAIALSYGMYEQRPDNRKGLLLKNNPRLLVLTVCIHYTFLTYMVMFGKPENHISVGLHQEYGDCNKKVVDYSGYLERNEYICREKRINWDAFEFVDSEMPKDGDRWYKIKGVAKSDEWVFGMTFTLFTSLTFISLLIASALYERSLITSREE
eukprot:g13849.t1